MTGFLTLLSSEPRPAPDLIPMCLREERMVKQQPEAAPNTQGSTSHPTSNMKTTGQEEKKEERWGRGKQKEGWNGEERREVGD